MLKRGHLRRLLFLFAAGLPLLMASPTEAGKRETEILQADVDELQRQVVEMKRLVQIQSATIQRLADDLGGSEARSQMAAFNANIDALRRDIAMLADNVESVNRRLGRIEDNFRRDSMAHVEPAGSTASESGVPGDTVAGDSGATTTVVPSRSLYNQAYADYLQEKYELAIAAFRDFLSASPSSDLADDAQYWIGMSYFNQRKFDAALSSFDTHLDRYPRADNRAEAMYRKGISLRELSRLGQAVLTLNELVTDYPGTEAARQAELRLHEMARGD